MDDPKALIAALAAAGAPSLADALGEAFDPRLVAIIVTGIGLGLFGGVVRAIVPWGQSSWGLRDGIKSILLGVCVGGGTALAITAAIGAFPWLKHYLGEPLGGPGCMALEALAGYLASKVLEQIDEVGPRGFMNWLARRGAPATPIAPPGKELP